MIIIYYEPYLGRIQGTVTSTQNNIIFKYLCAIKVNYQCMQNTGLVLFDSVNFFDSCYMYVFITFWLYRLLLHVRYSFSIKTGREKKKLPHASRLTILTELFCKPFAASLAFALPWSLLGFADIAVGIGIWGLVTDGGRIGIVWPEGSLIMIGPFTGTPLSDASWLELYNETEIKSCDWRIMSKVPYLDKSPPGQFPIM